MDRVNRLAAHLQPQPVSASVQSPDDIVIAGAVRTPIGRAKKGNLKDTTLEELLATALKGILDRSGIDPAKVEDIVVGNVLAPGGGATQARIGAFLAGFPEQVPIHTLNRQCSSGLQAFANVAAAVKAGVYDIGISAGMESMSMSDMMSAAPQELSDRVFEHDAARDCLTPMGITSENVAAKYGISRERQDAFAVQSHTKASAAQKSGKFKSEIVPVHTKVKDSEGNEREVVVSDDEGIRHSVSAANLAKLRAAFKADGSTTAGNASQVSDGAAAVLVMKRSTAARLHLPVLGRFVSYAAVGVPPAIMGIGPAAAIPAALKKANLSVNDIDVFEINEAFASQALFCVDDLKIPANKVNPSGGAIALGHPLGCTGSRQIATLLAEMSRNNNKYGVVSMCIGTGMGAAGVFARD